MRILVVMTVNENHRKVLTEAAKGEEIIFCEVPELTKELADSADVIIGNLPRELIVGSKNLKLLQLNNAGTDGYTDEGILPKGAILTNATGAYGVAISEHMIGMLLCMMKKLNLYLDNMKDNNWCDEGCVESVYGKNVLVVGFGDIGSEFAKRMNAMGAKVTGIRRTVGEKPDYLEALYQSESLLSELEKADIVAACLPQTFDTRKIFNEEAFSHMKDGAYFINIGRGTAVDQDALMKALKSGKLKAVCLDVTDPEPLPADNPLWNMPNVFITPHVSGGYHCEVTHDRIVDIAARNIRHFQNGEPLENVVDMKTGYKKH